MILWIKVHLFKLYETIGVGMMWLILIRLLDSNIVLHDEKYYLIQPKAHIKLSN